MNGLVRFLYCMATLGFVFELLAGFWVIPAAACLGLRCAGLDPTVCFLMFIGGSVVLYNVNIRVVERLNDAQDKKEAEAEAGG